MCLAYSIKYFFIKTTLIFLLEWVKFFIVLKNIYSLFYYKTNTLYKCTLQSTLNIKLGMVDWFGVTA